MRYFFIAIMLLLSLFLPGTLFYFWSWGGIKPDLLMLLTIYMALHHRNIPSALFGLGTGVIADLYFSRNLGMYATSLLVVAMLTNWLSKRWYKDNFLLITGLVFLVTFAGQVIIAFLSIGSGAHWSFIHALRLSFGISLYNSFLVPITYPWIHRSFTSGFLRYRPKYER